MLPVSLNFAAGLALVSLWLAYRTVRVRMGAKVMNGDGDNPLLLARMRAQANFVEYSPFVLALVALLELAGRPRQWLWGLAMVYIVARVLHPFGLERPAPNRLRAIGILLTWVILLVLAIWAIVVAATPLPGGHITYM